MKSRWFHLKNKAVSLRRQGLSIRTIEKKLEIPRSTLSGWFKTIELTTSQEEKLRENWHKALAKARKEAVKWHNNQKMKRLRDAEQWSKKTLSMINLDDTMFLHVAFAMLYLGEGFKKSSGAGMGNSDPLILQFFIKMLYFYGTSNEKIKCELHIRADQNTQKVKRYWSRKLNIPLSNFTSVSIDNRTKGSPTYKHYKGVCVVRGGSVDIQRKIIYFSKMFCSEVIKKRAVSSVG